MSDTNQSAESYVAAGLERAQDGNIQEALNLLSKAIEIDSESVSAYLSSWQSPRQSGQD